MVKSQTAYLKYQNMAYRHAMTCAGNLGESFVSISIETDTCVATDYDTKQTTVSDIEKEK